jgi:hypothetical protein
VTVIRASAAFRRLCRLASCEILLPVGDTAEIPAHPGLPGQRRQPPATLIEAVEEVELSG